MPSPPPSRFTAGISTDYPYGPLALYGMRNPFFYHEIEDDFDDNLTLANRWVKTFVGAGTIAAVAGDGGRVLFSTTAALNDLASIQLAVAGFQLVAGFKTFYMTSFQLSNAINAEFIAGLIQTTATPFTVTDGIYFSKLTGAANNLTLKYAIGGVITTVVIPTTAYTLANAIDIDLAIAVDRNGTVYAFVGAQLVGWLPQSGIGGLTPPSRGANAAISPALPLTAVNLNPTLAVRAGTAAIVTMNADFIMAAKER